MPSDQSTSTTLNNSATTEQCAICMENLTNQEVGIPENCEHPFCLTCIITWAQVRKISHKISLFLLNFFIFRKIIHVQLIV